MKEKTFFGQPMGLLSVFSTGICERFSFYTMRAMLFLFLTAAFATGGLWGGWGERVCPHRRYFGVVVVKTETCGGFVRPQCGGREE